MATQSSPTSLSYNRESLEVYNHLKSLVLSNAKLLHGGSTAGRARTYDIATATQDRGQKQYRVSLVMYEESNKVSGRVDVDAKVLGKSAVKLSLNLAMEDLLKNTQEQLWKEWWG